MAAGLLVGARPQLGSPGGEIIGNRRAERMGSPFARFRSIVGGVFVVYKRCGVFLRGLARGLSRDLTDLAAIHAAMLCTYFVLINERAGFFVCSITPNAKAEAGEFFIEPDLILFGLRAGKELRKRLAGGVFGDCPWPCHCRFPFWEDYGKISGVFPCLPMTTCGINLLRVYAGKWCFSSVSTCVFPRPPRLSVWRTGGPGFKSRRPDQ
jgi:hypothetical protein